MVNQSKPGQKKRPTILRKALKAAFKGVAVYAAYFVLSQFLSPLSEFVPGFQQIVETFVIVYIVLIIMAELTSGSILQHFFNATKALLIVAYIASSLGTGTFNLTMGTAGFVVDIHMFLVITMMLGLVGLAKSVVQTIYYLNQKAELALGETSAHM